jgi:hypothetical protein
MDDLLADHEALKGHFELNLKQASGAMGDVVELQKSYSKVLELESEHFQLKETVEGLSRLVTQREQEIASLNSQLKEVRYYH